MRMHTGLHLLCSLVKFPVTGGQVGAEEGRLDFDIEDASAVDKDRLSADLDGLIAADHPVSERWITDAELEANPGLVRTMAVKPPMGTGKVRLVVIGENGAVDLQPCGGTHVRTTGEIGQRCGHQNREEGQAEPPHPRRVRLNGGNTKACRTQPSGSSKRNWLAEHLNAPDLVVLDASLHLPVTGRNPKAEFLQAHIPGALFFDIEDVQTRRIRCPTCCRRRPNSPAA